MTTGQEGVRTRRIWQFISALLLTVSPSLPVRSLAVSGARRSPGFPDLPTIAEAGTWTGVIAPAGLPRPLIERLNAAVNEAIRSPLFTERFALIGDEPAGGTPEEFAATIRRDSARWGEVVKRSGAKID